jgi:ABC-type sugar transport system ATPase subunit
MAEVELQHLNKTYPGGVQAVRDLGLRVADGELLVLVGPSGSGKTTTLRLIAGLEQPDDGIVRVGAQDVTRFPPHRRDVALVFQRPALYPNRTVRDNLLFGLTLRDRSWRAKLGRWVGLPPSPGSEVESRLAEVGRLLDLGDVMGRRPAELSGGQQQRVALGRALLRRPAVFLLDEPLAHLDPRLRWEMRRDLHLLQRRLRATMIHVTHDQDEASALGDRVAVLDRGRLQQVGRPAVLYERPANLVVAGTLGREPINRLDGRLDRQDGRLSFRAGPWHLAVPESCRESWEGFTGRPLTLGLRPEHLGPVPLPEGGQARLTAEVALVERLGSVSLVTLARDGLSLTARWPGVPPGEGETVAAAADLERAHLFDHPGGTALAHGRDRVAPAG